MIALFTGRFDRPHCGHLHTIQLLGQRYDKVLVVVLDYERQRYPVEYRATILSELLRYSKGNYEVTTNNVNFEHADKHEIDRYTFDVYCSGNLKCCNKVMAMGYEVEFVDRSWDYEASKES